MVMQFSFVQSALQGLLLSLVFAFCVILVITQNIVIAFYSTLTIACVLSSVIGIMEMMGW
jgi:hypothetical protein